MIKILFSCFLVFLYVICNSAVVEMEFFFDTDPGFDQAESISFIPDEDVVINESIDLQSLETGFHYFYFRVKDENDYWSFTNSKPVFRLPDIETTESINRIEYFIDDIISFGNPEVIDVIPQFDLQENLIIDLSDVAEGFHKLCMKVITETGKQSMYYEKLFYRKANPSSISEIQKLEYFFDSDPGFGNGQNVTVNQSTSITKQFIANLSLLDSGTHNLYTRVKNQNWSFNQVQPIYKLPDLVTNNDIIGYEYFFDTDPGFGNATFVEIDSSEEVLENSVILLDSISLGFHRLYVRFLADNNKWSHSYSDMIFKLDAIVHHDISRIEWFFTGSDANPDQLYWIDNSESSTLLEEEFEVSLIHLTHGENYVMHMYAIDSDGKRSLEQQVTFELNYIPQNVIIEEIENSIKLSWNKVYGATGYKIYSSELQNGNFEIETTVSFSDTTWTSSLNTEKQFYYVISTYNQPIYSKICSKN